MIGERLYDLRKDAGMTQDELAELLKSANTPSLLMSEIKMSRPIP